MQKTSLSQLNIKQDKFKIFLTNESV